MTKLYRYQLKGVKKISRFKGRVLLADEPGLGKTIQTLIWMQENPDCFPAVIVCPAYLKYHWRNEAKRHIKRKSVILSGMTPERLYIDKEKLVIVSYNLLDAWVDELLRLKPRLIVLDEVHLTKNRGTVRTRRTVKLCKKRRYTIALSGTPIVQKPIEMFPVLNILWPKEFNSFYSFGNRYCAPTMTPWGMSYNGACRTKELRNRLLNLGMIRRKKKDVLKDLPKKTNTVLTVDLPSHKEYRAAESDFLGWLAKFDAGRVESASKAPGLTKLGYLLRMAARLKLPNVFDWINDFLAGDQKLLVFAIHKDIIERLHKRYRKLSVVITGKVPIKERQECVDEFQNNKQVRILFGNIQAAGVGNNLSAASKVLMAELDWVPGNNTQAADRAHRIGTEQPVEIVHMVARKTIEVKLCKVIQKKQEVLDRILDGEKLRDFNLFDKLLESLRR